MLHLPQAFDTGLENQVSGLRVVKTPGARSLFHPATGKVPQQASIGDGAGGAGGGDPAATPLRAKGANAAGRALRTPLGNISNRALSNSALAPGQLQSLSTPSISKPPLAVLEDVAHDRGSSSADLPPIEQYHTRAPSSAPFLDAYGDDAERAVHSLLGQTHGGHLGASSHTDPLCQAPVFVEPRVETASELATFGTPSASRLLGSHETSQILPRAMSDAHKAAASGGSLQVAAPAGEESEGAQTAAHMGNHEVDVGAELEIDLDALDFSQLARTPDSSASDAEEESDSVEC